MKPHHPGAAGASGLGPTRANRPPEYRPDGGAASPQERHGAGHIRVARCGLPSHAGLPSRVGCRAACPRGGRTLMSAVARCAWPLSRPTRGAALAASPAREEPSPRGDHAPGSQRQEDLRRTHRGEQRQLRRRRRRDLRAARPQWRRQDHAHPHDHRHRPARCRHGHVRRPHPERPRPAPHRVPARGTRAVQESAGPRRARLLRMRAANRSSCSRSSGWPHGPRSR